jgi:hypothetical protein
MSELEKTKYTAIENLKQLCARCSEANKHICPVAELISRIKGLDGVPVIVNERIKHVVFN